MIQIALYQPDIPQNLGTVIRYAACLNIPVNIILPCGFPLDDKRLKRAGMDYIEHATINKHVSWDHFYNHSQDPTQHKRIILFTTKTETHYTDFTFQPSDILLFGRESAGIPEDIANSCDHKITIPMHPPLRSLNIAMSVAMGTGEALRQTKGFYHE